jgi:phospholipid/cholesterol/gamma-HCH transport system permease protein
MDGKGNSFYKGNIKELLKSLFRFLGEWLLEKITYPFLISALFLRIIITFFTHFKKGRSLIRRIIVQQIYFTGFEALVLIIAVGILLGTLVILQSIAQLEKVGSEEVIGSLLVIIVVRELGPLITALVVILRSGTAISIELGYMKVLKEIQTLRMLGINPFHFIAVPRLAGMIISLICLFIIFDIVAILGGAIDAWLLAEISLPSLIDTVAKAITEVDLTVGFVKIIFFSFIIVIVSVFRGFSVQESITEVPPAASKSAVECFLLCLIFNVILSGIFYI